MIGFGERIPSTMTDADKIARAAEIEEQMRKLQDEHRELMREIGGQ